jgi:hypothetical protein
VRLSLFREPGLAQAFKNGLELGQIRRVTALCRPEGAGAGDGEGRVAREAGFDGGMRLVQSTKLREGGAHPEMRNRITSIGLDRPSKPRDCLLPTAEAIFRNSRDCHPDISERVARTEAQGLANVSLGVFGATDVNLAKSDKGMGVGEISIQL